MWHRSRQSYNIRPYIVKGHQWAAKERRKEAERRGRLRRIPCRADSCRGYESQLEDTKGRKERLTAFVDHTSRGKSPPEEGQGSTRCRGLARGRQALPCLRNRLVSFHGDSKARNAAAGGHRAKPSRSNGGRRLRLESLEIRSLLSASALGEAVPYHVAPVAQNGVVPLSTAAPTGYSPAQIRHAYGFDQITFNSGTVAGDGSGTTIAIVDAYDDPHIANDLHQFDLRYGLPDPGFHQSEPERRDELCRRPMRAGSPRLRWTWNGRTPLPRGPTSCWSRPPAPRSRPVDGGQLCPQRRRRGGGVDELGRRRFLRRAELRRLFHHSQRPRRGDLPGGLRRQRRPGRLSGDLAQRGRRRRHDAFAGRRGQLRQRIGLERQRRRPQRLRSRAGLPADRRHPDLHLPRQPRRGLRRQSQHRLLGLRLVQQSRSRRPGGSGAEPATPRRNGRHWWPSPIRDACWPARDRWTAPPRPCPCSTRSPAPTSTTSPAARAPAAPTIRPGRATIW